MLNGYRLAAAAGGVVLCFVAALSESITPLGGSPPPITGTVWKPIGPDPINEPNCCNTGLAFLANGRVNSIAVDPTNSDRIYIGSAGGGVWRSDNGGLNWTPLTDQEASLGIGS